MINTKIFTRIKKWSKNLTWSQKLQNFSSIFNILRYKLEKKNFDDYQNVRITHTEYPTLYEYFSFKSVKFHKNLRTAL